MRLNGFLIGYEPVTGDRLHYFPSLPKLLVTVGMFAVEVLGYIYHHPSLPGAAAGRRVQAAHTKGWRLKNVQAHND
jgi:Ni/Fe-hydrogenase subunit HybB-like protein